MGSWEKIQNKKGITYRYTEYLPPTESDPRPRFRKSWKPDPGMTEKQIEKMKKKLEAEYAIMIAQGKKGGKSKTFSEYAHEVIDSKKAQGLKKRTLGSYLYLLKRIDEGFGKMYLEDISVSVVRKFIDNLGMEGTRADPDRAVPKGNFRKMLKEKGFSMAKAATIAGVAESTVNASGRGAPILCEKAEVIAKAVGIPFDDLYLIEKRNKPLSRRTMEAYLTFIHLILGYAVNEDLIARNVAEKVKLPRKVKREVEALQLVEIYVIHEFAKSLPIKWRVIIHLLTITGMRRGELCGLKWEDIDWDHSRIHVRTALVYIPGEGVEETTTKNGRKRYITLPTELMEMLHEYLVWFDQNRIACGDLWVDSPYVFTGELGGYLAPDTVSGKFRKLEQRNNLPHINPHKFRHTAASLLFYSGVDPVTVARRLGHEQVSTTTDIYAHLMNEADQRSAELLAEAIYRAAGIQK